MIIVKKLNESFMHLDITDENERYIVNDHFTFYVKGYKFMPKYKAGLWDGKIYIFRDNMLPYGSTYELSNLCKMHNIELKIDNPSDFKIDKRGDQIDSFLESMKLEYTPFDSQREALDLSAQYNKCLFESSTASGKTFMAYLLTMLWIEVYDVKHVAIIVPNLKLLNQTYKEFGKFSKDYDKDFLKNNVSKFSGKNEPNFDMPIMIATWQSFGKLNREDYHIYGGIITDEAHEANAMTQTRIIENSINAKMRVAMTGSLKDSKVSKMQLIGNYGKHHVLITAKESIDKGIATKVVIERHILEYPDDIIKKIKSSTENVGYTNVLNDKGDFESMYDAPKAGMILYRASRDVIMTNYDRHRYIAKDAINRPNVSLILTLEREHGEAIMAVIDEEIENQCSDKVVYYVDGTTKIEYYDFVMNEVATKDNIILVATFGSLSTGVDNPNFHYAYLGDSIKESSLLKQVIGRIMRLNDNKQVATLVDIVDTLPKIDKHAENRLDVYENEGHYYSTKYAKI